MCVRKYAYKKQSGEIEDGRGRDRERERERERDRDRDREIERADLENIW
jgi:hypothetical protein